MPFYIEVAPGRTSVKERKPKNISSNRFRNNLLCLFSILMALPCNLKAFQRLCRPGRPRAPYLLLPLSLPSPTPHAFKNTTQACKVRKPRAPYHPLCPPELRTILPSSPRTLPTSRPLHGFQEERGEGKQMPESSFRKAREAP